MKSSEQGVLAREHVFDFEAWAATERANTPVAVVISIHMEPASTSTSDNLSFPLRQPDAHDFLVQMCREKAALIEAFMKTRAEVFEGVRIPLTSTAFGMITVSLKPEQLRVLKEEFLDAQDWCESVVSGEETELQGW